MAQVNKHLLRHKIILGLDDRGKLSCHKVNLCFIYFDTVDCIVSTFICNVILWSVFSLCCAEGYFCDVPHRNAIPEVLSQKDASRNSIPKPFLHGIPEPIFLEK
jgi:hypothetical protein